MVAVGVVGCPGKLAFVADRGLLRAKGVVGIKEK